MTLSFEANRFAPIRLEKLLVGHHTSSRQAARELSVVPVREATSELPENERSGAGWRRNLPTLVGLLIPIGFTTLFVLWWALQRGPHSSYGALVGGFHRL